MKNKITLFVTLAVTAALVSPVLAGWTKESRDVEHTGKVLVADQGELDVHGPLNIDGTEVTATAAELNALDADGSAAVSVGHSGVSMTVKDIGGSTAAKEVLSMGYTTAAITTDTTLTDGGSWALDVTTLDVTVTLPDANTVLGETIRIAVEGVTTSHAINTDGTDLYECGDGGASDDSCVLDAVGDAIWVQAVDSNTWRCLMQNSVSSWTTQ